MDRAVFIEQIMQSCTKTKNQTVKPAGEPAKMTITVTREELQRGQIQRHLDLIKRAEMKKTRSRSSITLTFAGYNSRGLIQHREIRDYLKRLFKNNPQMLYFLSKESNIQDILLSLLETDTGRYGDLFANRQKGYAEFTFYGVDLISHIRKHVEKAIHYANGLKEPASSQKELIVFLLDAMDYERLAADGEAL